MLGYHCVLTTYDKVRAVHHNSIVFFLRCRCLQQWGILAAAEAPVLDQLLLTLQQQLTTDDESAPAELAGLQGHVAYW